MGIEVEELDPLEEHLKSYLMILDLLLKVLEEERKCIKTSMIMVPVGSPEWISNKIRMKSLLGQIQFYQKKRNQKLMVQ